MLSLAHGERHEAMPAGVLQGDGVAVLRAVEHHLDARDGARQQLMAQLGVPGSGVPGVQGKGAGSGHAGLDGFKRRTD